jgi:sulfate adenylyltransferase
MSLAPHGGKLVTVSTFEGSQETQVQMFNISTGVLSPLTGFMGKADYENVIDNMRLADDTPWTIPVLLHVPETFSAGGRDEVTLVDELGNPVGLLAFEELFTISKKEYAKKVFGTEDEAHPGVAKTMASSERAVGGRLKSVLKFDKGPFENYTLSPRETRVLFKEKGWKDVIAFQTRNAPHIGHEYVQKTGLAFADGIFINPVLGKKKSGDFKDEVILETYQTLVKNYYPKNSVVLSVLHYEMQYAGPKEAIMHAIMRKNFGCTHIAN